MSKKLNWLQVLQAGLKTRVRMTLLCGAALLSFGGSAWAAPYTVDADGGAINTTTGTAEVDVATKLVLKVGDAGEANIGTTDTLTVSGGTVVVTGDATGLTGLSTVVVDSDQSLTIEIDGSNTFTIGNLTLGDTTNIGTLTNTAGAAVDTLKILAGGATIDGASATTIAGTTTLGGNLTTGAKMVTLTGTTYVGADGTVTAGAGGIKMGTVNFSADTTTLTLTGGAAGTEDRFTIESIDGKRNGAGNNGALTVGINTKVTVTGAITNIGKITTTNGADNKRSPLIANTISSGDSGAWNVTAANLANDGMIILTGANTINFTGDNASTGSILFSGSGNKVTIDASTANASYADNLNFHNVADTGTIVSDVAFVTDNKGLNIGTLGGTLGVGAGEANKAATGKSIVNLSGVATINAIAVSTNNAGGGSLNFINVGDAQTLITVTNLASCGLNGGGALNFLGGKIAATAFDNGDITAGDAGTIRFDMSKYTANVAGIPPEAAIIAYAGAAGNALDQTKLGIVTYTGGKAGEYRLISEDNNAATEATAEFLTNRTLLRNYVVECNGNDYLLNIAANRGGLVAAATNANGANVGIANALSDMMDSGALPTEVEAYLTRYENNAAGLGRAVTELNGANAAASAGQTAVNAAQAFNTQLAGALNSRHAANMINRSGALGGMPTSAAAGGTPVTYGETANGDCYRWDGMVKAYGGFGGQDNSSNAVGYDFGGVGVMASLDYKVAQEFTVGALFGYSWNKGTMREQFGEATDNLLRMGMYGQFTWDGFYLNTAPTFGIHILETNRRVMDMTGKGQRTGFDFNWYNEVGYTFDLKGILITPNYSLAMTYMHDPKYTESNLGGAALTVNAQDQWALTQNLGLRLGKVFCISSGWQILPEIFGGWEHEYLDSNDVSMAFAAVPQNGWNAPVQRIAADRAVFGAGITNIISNRYEIFGRYDQKIWDGGYSTNFMVGLGIKF